MNGATAEPWLNTIKPPNKNKTKNNNIGSNQYFFLTFKNSQNSIKKSMIRIDFSFYFLF